MQVSGITTRARDAMEEALYAAEVAAADGRGLTPAETVRLLGHLRAAARLLGQVDDAVLLAVTLLRTGESGKRARALRRDYEAMHQGEKGRAVA